MRLSLSVRKQGSITYVLNFDPSRNILTLTLKQWAIHEIIFRAGSLSTEITDNWKNNDCEIQNSDQHAACPGLV